MQVAVCAFRRHVSATAWGLCGHKYVCNECASSQLVSAQSTPLGPVPLSLHSFPRGADLGLPSNPQLPG